MSYATKRTKVRSIHSVLRKVAEDLALFVCGFRPLSPVSRLVARCARNDHDFTVQYNRRLAIGHAQHLNACAFFISHSLF
jgi:hypothetical protein